LPQPAFGGISGWLLGVRHTVAPAFTPARCQTIFGTLKYEHLYRAPIDDGDTFAIEINRFRQIYNTICPHQALADRTIRDAYLGES
jgi:putative transposase